MNAISLKTKLAKGLTTLGGWISLHHPAIAEIFSTSGYDWVMIDLEHSTINIKEAGELIRVIDLCNCTPIVRVTSNNADQIKRVMDAGAHGILVPMVKTKEDVVNARNAVKYPPLGSRSVGLARAQGYGSKFKEYQDWLNNDSILLIQIEHIDAVNNLEDILTTPGLDGFIVGPYDLSCSLGEPGIFNTVKFKSAMKKIEDTAKRLKIPSGFHIVEPDTLALENMIKAGHQLIAFSVDIRLLESGIQNGRQQFERLIKCK